MANVLIFDKTTGYPVDYLLSVHTPDHVDRDDVLINPDMTNIDLKASIVENGQIRNLNPIELDAKITADKLVNYRKYRAAEYPSLADQLDMQYKDKLNGTTTWEDAIQAVKDKYPKPE